MNWIIARKWCQAHYIDLVAIQSREENVYLNDYLPQQKKYYWIGIRKLKREWNLVAINKSLTPEVSNWAPNEPNNGKGNERCVEIYIKSAKNSGTWNDESCLRNKTALCYKASCRPDSCSGNGECMENINNHTCKCSQGFYGVRCENAIKCRELASPAHGSMRCTRPLGSFFYKAECEFHCEERYRLNTSSKLLCGPDGQWTDSQPQCEVSCQLDSCSGNGECVETNNSLKCRCFQGFYGQRCESAVLCSIIQAPRDGSVICPGSTGELRYGSTCSFACHAGFTLHGTKVMMCNASGEWVGEKPLCQVHRSLLMDVVKWVVAALTVLPIIVWVFILYQRKKKAKQFGLNNDTYSDNPPEVYRNSAESLI
ncbi:hypothetical protein COCON_G00090740 [Conger conger]|uniref:E-selectin n=1 Tax=Conger conger TaxID=82655 RepID=A0A9Q1DL00_CONCO|nr:E-selectin-like [Conger conger]KAJ8274449.1 hypothetical protein COCON_G00090740 [Conger conger]